MSQFLNNMYNSFVSTFSADNKEAVDEVVNIHKNNSLCNIARKYELDIQPISWEDTARFKNSCWGPNISDMTLSLSQGANKDERLLPMIRAPNFADKTSDMAIEKFSVTVGNERPSSSLSSSTVQRITLQDYLTNAPKYLSSDKNINGIVDGINTKVKSLYLERDKNILTSAQFCILPLSKGKCEFNVSLYNYQSTKENPAVLVIVASSQGTSAQVIVDGKTRLYFNHHGKAANFQAVRLKDDRAARGKIVEGKMDLEEQERNVLFVYQVPLKQKVVARNNFYDDCNEQLQCLSTSSNCVLELHSKSFSKSTNSSGGRKKRGMDHAMLNVGATHSDYVGVGDYEIERDPRFPIRCTLKYYKVTDDANIPESEFQEMYEKILKTYKTGVQFGSLVIDGSTNRTTDAMVNMDIDSNNIPLYDVNLQQRQNNPLFSLFSS